MKQSPSSEVATASGQRAFCECVGVQTSAKRPSCALDGNALVVVAVLVEPLLHGGRVGEQRLAGRDEARVGRGRIHRVIQPFLRPARPFVTADKIDRREAAVGENLAHGAADAVAVKRALRNRVGVSVKAEDEQPAAGLVKGHALMHDRVGVRGDDVLNAVGVGDDALGDAVRRKRLDRQRPAYPVLRPGEKARARREMLVERVAEVLEVEPAVKIRQVGGVVIRPAAALAQLGAVPVGARDLKVGDARGPAQAAVVLFDVGAIRAAIARVSAVVHIVRSFL